MPTIEFLTARSEAVSPDTPVAHVLSRFEQEPDTLAIAVVEADRPVGLVERDQFLLKLAAPLGRVLYAERTVSHLMDTEPAVFEAGVRIDTIGDILLRNDAGSLTRGYIVTRQGEYYGVGTSITLLKAVAEHERARNIELMRQADELTDTHSRARALAEEKSRFLNVIGQELRTSMNGVLAVAELLRRQSLNPAARAHVDTIADSSNALMSVLEDALDLARAEAGEMALHPGPVSLRALMDDIQADWAPRAAQDGVTLLVGYEGDTELAAVLDGGRARQVFNTLIGAALKFARDGVVEASLRAWAEGDRLCLEGRVRDDGPGLTPDEAQALFEPFGQSGGDLSLALCRQIVDHMGGRLWAENNAGRGMTYAFDVAAPRAILKAEPGDNVADMPTLDLSTRPHILIVDDNATNRVVAQALCEMFGCTSEMAEDGVEAVEAVAQRPFDLVLMDIKMPRMDGVQATQAIRALPGPEALTPIVALTANADPDDAQRYLSIGMAAVVEKPIKPERLLMAMTTALETPQAEPERASPALQRSVA